MFIVNLIDEENTGALVANINWSGKQCNTVDQTPEFDGTEQAVATVHHCTGYFALV